jgi:hypothetical protein
MRWSPSRPRAFDRGQRISGVVAYNSRLGVMSGGAIDLRQAWLWRVPSVCDGYVEKAKENTKETAEQL